MPPPRGHGTTAATSWHHVAQWEPPVNIWAWATARACGRSLPAAPTSMKEGWPGGLPSVVCAQSWGAGLCSCSLGKTAGPFVGIIIRTRSPSPRGSPCFRTSILPCTAPCGLATYSSFQPTRARVQAGGGDFSSMTQGDDAFNGQSWSRCLGPSAP